MRIDKFLYFIRLIKSRGQAQALIEEGRTRIDGRRVEKLSDTVRVGSTVALPLRGEVRILRVLALPTRRGPAPEARACYDEIAESPRARHDPVEGWEENELSVSAATRFPPVDGTSGPA